MLVPQVAFPPNVSLVSKPPASSIASPFPVQTEIYRDGWIDLNKNRRKDPYEDSSLPIEKRIDDLLKRMTVEEKTVQCVTLYGYPNILKDRVPTFAWKTALWKDGIANIDEQLNGNFGTPTDPAYFWPPSAHVDALNQIQRFFIEQTRLGIPADFTNEGIKGVAAFKATNFPIPLGLGCTWNPSLIRQVGEITGREGRALGFTNVYAPILDVLRDQRWGRSEESFGEDPWLVSRMGVQLAKGIQSQGVASTAKHFAVYSYNKGAREGQARTDPEIGPREVEEIALRPFRDAVEEAGLLGVMASYNDYDGVPIIASKAFLTDRLRKEYGFRGYVVSDSDAVEYVKTKHGVATDLKDAICQEMVAGLNVRTTFSKPEDFVMPLREAVAEKKLAMSVLDSRVRDVLRVKFILGLFDRPYRGDLAQADALIASPANEAVALQASRESIVLLRNEGNTLPLAKSAKIAVIGPNATAVDWAKKRYGPTHVDVVSILDSIRTVAPDALYAKGCDIVDAGFPDSELDPTPLTAAEQKGIDEAIETAKKADRVILILGDSNRTSGESRSRTSLDLPGRQMDLVRSVAATGKPITAVIVAGRPMSINWISKNVPGVLWAFAPGAHGSQAITEALFGDLNPGGKLNCTFPKTVGQIPLNFPSKPHANEESLGKSGAGVSGPLYPFGYGLSYTKFAYDSLTVTNEGKNVRVRFAVKNVGPRSGDEVAQLYTRQLVSSVTTYEKNLRGFKRVHLEPGESVTVDLLLTPKELQILGRNGKWAVEPGQFNVMVGASSEDIRLKGSFTIR